MMPILYAAGAATFENNGLGGLSDAIECIVEEERNGAYTLKMVYPIDGAHYDDLALSAVIKADCGGHRGEQLFRICKVTRPMAGRVTVSATHISYQLSMIPCAPFTASTVGTALQGLKNNAAEACPFTFSTDKSTTATYTQAVPASIRSRLGGVEGSILDVYGGEFEFDNYAVKLWANRGVDRGVTLRYGKNLTDLTQESNIENTITGVYPYWADEFKTVTLPEKVIHAASASSYPFPRTIPLDCSQDFSEEPSVADLRTYATSYVSRSGIGVPKVSIKVSFVNLRDTEEYADVAALETVELCDYVTVIYDRLGVNTKAQIVKTTWDVLAERYNAVEIGDVRTSLAETITVAAEEASEAVSPSALASAVTRATDRITGVTGGYIKYKYNGDGQPTEMLIMDAPDEADATHLWRYNYAGWGYSSNGGATYTMAATMDGGIVADFITAGTLTGLNINNGNGTFSVDSAGNVIANSLTSTNATITGGSIRITTSSETDSRLALHYVKHHYEVSPFGATATYDGAVGNAAVSSAHTADGFFIQSADNAQLVDLRGTSLGGDVTIYDLNGNVRAELYGRSWGGSLAIYDESGTKAVSADDGGLKIYGSDGNVVTTFGRSAVDFIGSITISGTSGYTGYWIKYGRTVEVYLNVKKNNANTNLTVTLSNTNIYAHGQYAVLPVYSGSAPYAAVGSMWLENSGTAHIYLPSATGTYYVCGCYTAN